MKDLKAALIDVGYDNPDLKEDLSKVIQAVEASSNWREIPVKVRGRDFVLGDILGGKLYHGSPYEMKPGTILKPGMNPVNYSQSKQVVSLTSDLQKALWWGSLEGTRDVFVYEVEPLGLVTPHRMGLANQGKNITAFEVTCKQAKILKVHSKRKAWKSKKSSLSDSDMDHLKEKLEWALSKLDSGRGRYVHTWVAQGRVNGSFRSDLGEYPDEYELDMRISETKDTLHDLLRGYASDIRRINVFQGDKDYLEVTLVLK